MFGVLPCDIQEKIFDLFLSNDEIYELEEQIEKIEKLISIVEINKPDILAFKRLHAKHDMVQMEPFYYLRDEFNKRLVEYDDEFNEDFFVDYVVEHLNNLHEVFIEERAYIQGLFIE